MNGQAKEESTDVSGKVDKGFRKAPEPWSAATWRHHGSPVMFNTLKMIKLLRKLCEKRSKEIPNCCLVNILNEFIFNKMNMNTNK